MIQNLIRKDIQRKLKQPGGLITLMAMPLLFALLLGWIFGPNKKDQSMIQVKLFIEDHDDSFVSQFLIGTFGRGELQNMFNVTAVDSGSGRELMDQDKASALLIIPNGFGDSLLNRSPVSLSLIKNPSEAFGPKIAEETVSILAEGGDRLLWIGEKPLTVLKKQIESDKDPSEIQIALMAVQIYNLINQAGKFLFPPRINIKEEITGESQQTNTSLIYASILAGIVVMTLFFTMELLARDFFIEKENHTLYRILVSPLGIRSFILSKMLFLFVTGFLAHGLVWFLASLFFNIQLNFSQILRLLTFSLIILASLTGIISFLYSMVRTREQAQSISAAIILLLSMLGGSMVPLEALPRFIRQMAVASPVYWGSDGLKKIVLSTAPLSDILIHCLILAAIALIFLFTSFVIYQRKLRS